VCWQNKHNKATSCVARWFTLHWQHSCQYNLLPGRHAPLLSKGTCLRYSCLVVPPLRAATPESCYICLQALPDEPNKEQVLRAVHFPVLLSLLAATYTSYTTSVSPSPT
jgi:hypothetical protein